MSSQTSIIIPTYNHSQYLLTTLNSVFAQTYQDYEIIVINDGSPDDTAQVIKPLVEKNRIQYIEQENGGQAAARNRGLKAARGEFIAFLDDDDLWPSDKLEWQVAYLTSHAEAVAVGGGVQYVDDNGGQTSDAACPETVVTFESLFRGSPFVSPGQTLVRAADLKAIGGLNENLWGVDDFDLWFRLARRGKISVLPRLSLYYRLHASNASKNTSKMFYNALDLIKTQLTENPPNKRPRLSRDAYRWIYSYAGQSALHDLKMNKFKSPKDTLQNIKRFSYFIVPMLRDRTLLRKILQDVMPRALKKSSNLND